MAIKRERHSTSAAWSQINQHRYHLHIHDPLTDIHHQVRVVITDDLPVADSDRVFDSAAMRSYIDAIDVRGRVLSCQEMTNMDVELPPSPEPSIIITDDLQIRREERRDGRERRGF